MSLKKYKKIKILGGDDMYPEIDPKKYHLLDENATPKKGDVIVFLNRYDKKIAHRLYYKTFNYYFTRGDRCKVFNFPSKKEEVLGVIVGKHKPIPRNIPLNLFLNFFLLYYLAYKSIFDIRKKKKFLILQIFSRILARNKDYKPQKFNIDKLRK